MRVLHYEGMRVNKLKNDDFTPLKYNFHCAFYSLSLRNRMRYLMTSKNTQNVLKVMQKIAQKSGEIKEIINIE